jgi:hypothetical protein
MIVKCLTTKIGCNFQKSNQIQTFGSIQKIEIETILIYLLKLELEVFHKSKQPFNIENNLLICNFEPYSL